MIIWHVVEREVFLTARPLGQFPSMSKPEMIFLFKVMEKDRPNTQLFIGAHYFGRGARQCHMQHIRKPEIH